MPEPPSAGQLSSNDANPGGVSRRALFAAPALLGVRSEDRIRAGVIGCGSRGSYHVRSLPECGAQVVHVCDVYSRNRAAAQALAPGSQACEDYRRLLDDRSVQAVVITTPDHLHARIAIDAMEAGKDVYLEKPLAHTIEEGFQVVEAARRTGRVVQVGMQRRSMKVFQDARGLLASSTGTVKLVNSWWYNRIDRLNPGPLAGELNWEGFLGPAARRPKDPVRFLNWYWFWDYGGGMMSAQASHIVDAITWLLGLRYPRAVTASGNGLSLPLAEVPPNTSMSIEYAGDILVVFTVGYHAMQYSQRLDQLIQFHGSKARLDLGREYYSLYPEDPRSADLAAGASADEPGAFARSTSQHVREFLACVRSRKAPSASPSAAQFTNVALCMASESLRCGRRVTFDENSGRMRS